MKDNQELVTQITAKVMEELRDIKVDNQYRAEITNKMLKTISTTFIGAIASCEDNLGYLWGHNLRPGESRTEAEQEIFLKWEKTRQSILDKGNNQSRILYDIIKRMNVEPKTN